MQSIKINYVYLEHEKVELLQINFISSEKIYAVFVAYYNAIKFINFIYSIKYKF